MAAEISKELKLNKKPFFRFSVKICFGMAIELTNIIARLDLSEAGKKLKAFQAFEAHPFLRQSLVEIFYFVTFSFPTKKLKLFCTFVLMC